MQHTIITKSTAQTQNFAKNLAKYIKNNSTIGLIGELGGGKTQFVKGFVRHFNIKDNEVSSPSFTIANIYKKNKTTICHIDFYRLNKTVEIEQLGLNDIIQNATAALIEWYDKSCQSIEASIKIYFKIMNKNKRQLKIVFRPKDHPDLKTHLLKVKT